MLIRRLGGVAVVALSAPLSVLACSTPDDLIVQTGVDHALGPIDIDKAPLSLLPGGVVGIASVDTTKLFASQFGARVATILAHQLPVPAAAGFDATRDLRHLYVGFYSMQGADISGVAVGHFDKSKIEAAVSGVTQTATGVPITQRSYAGRSLFTAAGFGFCVLTDHSALFGNDTGIRRALDRIHEGRVRRQTAPWMDQLLTRESAPIVAGADLRAQTIPEAASSNLAFLNGLQTLSLVGNFADPGLNLAGTLVYGDDAAAKQGAENVQSLAQKLGTYGVLLSLIGFPQPVRQLEAQAKGKQAAFVVGLDAAALEALLDKLPDYLAKVRGASR